MDPIEAARGIQEDIKEASGLTGFAAVKADIWIHTLWRGGDDFYPPAETYDRAEQKTFLMISGTVGWKGRKIKLKKCMINAEPFSNVGSKTNKANHICRVIVRLLNEC